MAREKGTRGEGPRRFNGCDSARSMAKTIVSQGEVGRYAGMFDLICERLASRPDDRESAQLLAQLKRLRRADASGDEFDRAEPSA